MLALLRLIGDLGQARSLEQVELLRELGEFDEAARALKEAKKESSTALYKVSAELIAGRHAAPVRYTA